MIRSTWLGNLLTFVAMCIIGAITLQNVESFVYALFAVALLEWAHFVERDHCHAQYLEVARKLQRFMRGEE